jgi:hypothetical protein
MPVSNGHCRLELGEFVTEALVQLVKGIENANVALAPGKEKAEQPFVLYYSGGDPQRAPHIEFDVAVTTLSSFKGEVEVKGKSKLYVVDSELDVSGSLSKDKESVSRVKFSVGVKHHQG